MKKNGITVALLLAVFVCTIALVCAGPVWAEESIRYACSAQVYDALENKRIEAFTKRTGIKVDVNVCSSAAAVNSIRNGYSDIAATARRLYSRHQEYGYWETIFSKDPMIVIVNRENPVSNLSVEDLRDIFSGNIAYWNEVAGGLERPVLLVAPGKNTAAFKNFERNLMQRAPIAYDILTFKSTMVAEVVERFPNAVSFIAGGVANPGTVKTLAIDGVSPADGDYPYYQIFSFVTKGKPEGAVKQFVDDVLSGEGKKMMMEAGMTPYCEKEK